MIACLLHFPAGVLARSALARSALPRRVLLRGVLARIGRVALAMTVALALVSFLALAGPATAREPVYLKPDAVDLTRILPPPPPDQSEKTREDLRFLLELQAARSDEAIAVALADVDSHIHRFSGAMGTTLTPDRAPLTNALVDRAWRDARVINRAAKARFNRTRPYDLDGRLKTVVPRENSGSYPSSHAAYGVFAAILLANMVPERAPHLYARGNEFGFGRLLAGVHYPSDVEAGRVAGTVLAAFILASPAFQADLAPATAEVRALLSLPPLPNRVAAPAGTDAPAVKAPGANTPAARPPSESAAPAVSADPASVPSAPASAR